MLVRHPCDLPVTWMMSLYQQVCPPKYQQPTLMWQKFWTLLTSKTKQQNNELKQCNKELEERNKELEEQNDEMNFDLSFPHCCSVSIHYIAGLFHFTVSFGCLVMTINDKLQQVYVLTFIHESLSVT